MLGSSSNCSSTNSQPCFHFERGHCYRGERCRFLHIQKLDSISTQAQDEGINVDSVSVARQDRFAQPISSYSTLNKQVCRQFASSGWCNFGSSCRYAHSSRYEEGRPTNVELPVAQNIDETFIGVERYQSDDQVNENRRICRFYRAGYCRYGRQCQFQHVKKEVRHGQKAIKLGGIPGIDKADGAGVDQSSVELAVVDGGASKYLQHAEVKVKPIRQPRDLKKMRETEITQFRRRYPKAIDVKSETGTTFKFLFEPTDPDWPYDVKQMNMEVTFPENYPEEMMLVRLTDNERMPGTVERMLTEYIKCWVMKRHHADCKRPELMFRPFLHWLDRNSENLVTEALKEYKRELMAKAAGIEFIPANKLRELYPEAASGKAKTDSMVNESNVTASQSQCNVEADQSNPMQPSSEAVSDAGTQESEGVGKLEEHSETAQSTGKEIADESQSSVTDGVTLACRKGTEVSLMGLQLMDGAATLTAKQLMLMVSCSRCTNSCEAKLVPGHVFQMACPRCHNDQLMELSAAIIHQMSSVVGWLHLSGCQAVDLILANCQFVIGCDNCSEQEAINAISPGQPNTTWCRRCHQKLTIFANAARFVQLSPTTQLDTSRAIQLEAKKPVKAVRDPAIKEGQPLPDNGTCKHFKKSYRWLRFPCCGKAYPCDRCHDEKELDHEMKLANRMICGFCAKEQAYSPEKPCSQCNSMMINKTTAYWEGGKGCRDQIKMSRNDPKKYLNCGKTVSATNEKNASKKITKVRHA